MGLSIFPKQALLVRHGSYGQAALLLLTTLSAVLSIVFTAVHVAHLGAEKVASANAIDAIALSAATWEARGLNMIAALNNGIEQCLRLIRWTCVLWAAAAIAACTGFGLPAFLEYSKQAARIIRSSWNTARQFATWAAKIKDAVPFLILAESVLLARKLKVTGALYPFDPRGPHEHERTLELHLTQGPPLTLADSLFPIHNVIRKIGKWKWAKKIAGKVVSIIGSALQSALGSETAPIFMLVPEDHFPDRQKVRFAGFREVAPIPFPFLPAPSKYRFLFDTAAEPYGGGATEMSWKSRYTEWRREK